jgi:hypothetical protein
MLVDNLLTREELDALPDDGLRHELIDGAFVMTRRPGLGISGWRPSCTQPCGWHALGRI